MSDESSNEETVPAENSESLNRRLFLRSVGKWSGAAIVAAVVGCVVFSPRSARRRMGKSQGNRSRRRLDQRWRLGQSRGGVDQWPRGRRWLDKPPRLGRRRLDQSLVNSLTESVACRRKSKNH